MDLRPVLVAALLLLPACGILGTPDPGGAVPGKPYPRSATSGPENVLDPNAWGNLLHEFRWWALLGLLFFPQVRKALGEFLRLMFAVPAAGLARLLETLKRKNGGPKPPSS